MTTLVSIDPGISSGIVIGTFSKEQPLQIVGGSQVEGGLEGFLGFLSANDLKFPDADSPSGFGDTVYVAERFVPLAAQGFSHTAKSVEPLRVEGALVALGYMPADPTEPGWQRPSQQYWVQGKNATEKRRRQKAWFKEHHPELYKTGKDVGCKDAEDYWSALFHAFAYLRGLRHEPTLRYYWPEREE